MSSQLFPVIGNWYKDSSERIFEVVSMDEAENGIEIQYFGGEIDELEFETWQTMVVENIPPPEDWSGAYGDIEPDDFGFSDFGTCGSHMESPFSIDDLD